MKLFSYFKNDIIEFYCSEEMFDVIPKPIPAYKCMPDWFKKIPIEMPNRRDHFGAKGMTAKKCMPLLDAMSIGFIMPLFADANIRTNDSGSLIEVGASSPFGDIIQFHSKDQVGGKTSPTYPADAIKFINKWVIKTAPGYSTLFIPPINHIEPRFTCLGGFVDTDTYAKEVNFPAIWHEKNYDGIVNAGTPIVTVIPIKRKNLPKNSPIRKMTDDEAKYISVVDLKQNSRRGVYTNELREPRK